MLAVWYVTSLLTPSEGPVDLWRGLLVTFLLIQAFWRIGRKRR
jgi:hypothetical protein